MRENWTIYDPAAGVELFRGQSDTPGAAARQYVPPGKVLLELDYSPEPGQPLDAEQVRGALWKKAKAERDAAIDAGAPTPFGPVQCDPISRGNIVGAVVASMLAQAAGAPFAITWTMADNSTVELDAAAMQAVGLAAFQHVDAIHAASRKLRGALEATVTLDRLLLIDVAADLAGSPSR